MEQETIEKLIKNKIGVLYVKLYSTGASNMEAHTDVTKRVAELVSSELQKQREAIEGKVKKLHKGEPKTEHDKNFLQYRCGYDNALDDILTALKN